MSDKRAGHVSDKVKFMVPEKMEPKPKKERQRSKGAFENVIELLEIHHVLH